MVEAKRRARSKLWRLLMFVSFVATLWTPFFNVIEPTFYGIPFFYWYLMAWIPLNSVLIGIVYWLEE